jgi:hypothetical protein
MIRRNPALCFLILVQTSMRISEIELLSNLLSNSTAGNERSLIWVKRFFSVHLIKLLNISFLFKSFSFHHARCQLSTSHLYFIQFLRLLGRQRFTSKSFYPHLSIRFDLVTLWKCRIIHFLTNSYELAPWKSA